MIDPESDDDSHLPDPGEFLSMGWQERISGITSYIDLWDHLSEIAREVETSDPATSYGLTTLAKAASLRFSEAHPNQPFVPIAALQDKRSAGLADFSSLEQMFLADIASGIDNLHLRARVADVLWVTLTADRFPFAVLAIQSYVQFPVSPDSWFTEGHDAYTRAFAIANRLGSTGTAQIADHITRLSTLALAADQESGFFCLQICDVLPRERLETDEIHAIGTHLQAVGESLSAASDYIKARRYFRAAIDWLGRGVDVSTKTTLIVRIAEAYVAQSEGHSTGSPHADALLAQMNREKAIQTYREIPRKMRALHGVDEAIERIQRDLSEFGRAGLEHFEPVLSEPVDMSDSAESARAAVANLPEDEALRRFANIFVFYDSQRALREAEERVRSYPLQNLFGAVHLSSDGRVVSKRIRGAADRGTLNYEEHLKFQVFRMYPIHIGLVSLGRILPALQVLRSEHQIRFPELLEIVRESSIVPGDCTHLYARGLELGFQGDFLGAMHILAPQIENIVRAHLKASGVLTTHLDQDGIESEVGLSALLEKSEIRTIFGSDLSLELECLFTSQVGPNYRNRVAHGLMRDHEQNTAEILYAWWFCFRAVYVPFWNRLRERQSYPVEEASPTPAAAKPETAQEQTAPPPGPMQTCPES